MFSIGSQVNTGAFYRNYVELEIEIRLYNNNLECSGRILRRGELVLGAHTAGKNLGVTVTVP